MPFDGSQPSSTQYFLGFVTLLLGSAGAELQRRAGILVGSAEAVHPQYQLGALGAKIDDAIVKSSAERRRLIERASVLTSTSTAILFFALVSALTINFPAFWSIGCFAGLVAVVWGASAWARLLDIDRRVSIFIRVQQLLLGKQGFIFSVDSAATLNQAVKLSGSDFERALELLNRAEYRGAGVAAEKVPADVQIGPDALAGTACDQNKP